MNMIQENYYKICFFILIIGKYQVLVQKQHTKFCILLPNNKILKYMKHPNLSLTFVGFQ